MEIKLTKKEWLIFLGFGILLFIIPYLFTRRWGILPIEDVGGTIGGVTAPFLGFFGSILVYLALKSQVVANNKIQEQFKEQERTNYRQNFENTFFNLLTIHNSILENIDFETRDITKYDILEDYFKKNIVYEFINKEINENNPLHSRDVFRFSHRILFSLIEDDLMFEKKIPLNFYTENDLVRQKKQFELIKNINTKELKYNDYIINTKFQDLYDLIYFKINSDFGHYFRNLYRIIKIIDEKTFVEDEIENFNIKYSYTSIVRAQLSDDEIKWLFFNCLSNKGFKKFKPLIEKYTLLKIIDRDNLVNKYYSPLYLETAFKKPKKEEISEHINKFKN